MWKLPVIIGLLTTLTWAQEETPDKRLRHSTDLLQSIVSAPNGIPHRLFERAKCVMVVPGLKKGAFVFGADYGRGFAVCRSGDSWGGPAAIRMGGGSFGAQLGLESTDVVMLVMNQKGMNRLTRDKFTIGADASAAIGPLGRDFTADTDATLRAEILSYSSSKGNICGSGPRRHHNYAGPFGRPQALWPQCEHRGNSPGQGRAFPSRQFTPCSVERLLTEQCAAGCRRGPAADFHASSAAFDSGAN